VAWSPNGRFLALLQANSYNNQTSRLWTLRLSDEKWTAITENSKEINWSPSWSPDSRSLFFYVEPRRHDGSMAAAID
jgi:Tol biopolymer transport system component